MYKYTFTILIPLCLAVMNLALIFTAKYYTNNISFTELSVTNLGNVFNITVFLLLSASIVANGLLFSDKNSSFNYIVIIFLLISFLTLFTAIILKKINYTNDSIYIISYPFAKALIGFLMIISLAVSVYVTILLFKRVIDNGNISYLSSFYTLTAVFIILVAFAFLYTTVFHDGRFKDDGHSYELAVVLGAAVIQKDQPSGLFKGRIDKSYDMWKHKEVSKIHLTGSNAPGEITEAKAAENYLLRKGVPKSFLLKEENTTTSVEQVMFIRDNLIRKSGYKKIVVISDRFHLRRVMEICKFFGIDVYAEKSNSEIRLKNLFFYKFRESFALLLFWFFAI